MPRKNIGLTAGGQRKEKKATLTHNDMDINIQEVRQIDSGKVSLRIDNKTMILVKPENNTKEYAEQYRQNMQQFREMYR